MTLKHFLPTLCLTLLLSSCQSAFQPPLTAPPQIAEHTMSGDILAALPPAKRKVAVSVYEFQDQTGQMKSDDTFAEYSSAVTKGGLSILNKALLDAGNRGWFTVIERGGLKDLTQERQIITSTREQYHAPGTEVMQLKPMLYAGILLEGAIVAYESNVITGGAGAKYLGVGGDTQYRRDIVTVYLRAVSTQTGEVLLSVNTSKTIYSTAVDASVFRYVSYDKLLELETGFTTNEPPQFAVRQAIEMGVYALIMEGTIDGLWEFADPNAQKAQITEYLERKGSGGSSENQSATASPVAQAQASIQANKAIAASSPVPVLQPPHNLILAAPNPAPAAPAVAVVPTPVAAAPVTAASSVAPAAAPGNNLLAAPSQPAVQLVPPVPQSQQLQELPTANGRWLPDSKYPQMRAAAKKCNPQSDIYADSCVM